MSPAVLTATSGAPLKGRAISTLPGASPGPTIIFRSCARSATPYCMVRIRGNGHVCCSRIWLTHSLRLPNRVATLSKSLAAIPIVSLPPEQIVDVLKERGQSPKDAHKLVKAAYDVIEEMMSAAKEVRNFLEKIAKVCTKYNKPLRWETPARSAGAVTMRLST